MRELARRTSSVLKRPYDGITPSGRGVVTTPDPQRNLRPISRLLLSGDKVEDAYRAEAWRREQRAVRPMSERQRELARLFQRRRELDRMISTLRKIQERPR
jgi:hypothetical protein